MTDATARRSRNGPAEFDPVAALDDLLSDVGLSSSAAGGSLAFTGEDPILPAVHRLGACIGVPLMANAVAAVALHRIRGGPVQDLELDLRKAVHGINPGAFWHPTLNGESAPHPLVIDNPFLVIPYRCANGRWVMASGVYPHLAARWCRFLDVPPDAERVASAIADWDAFELEEAASVSGPADLGGSLPDRVADPRAGFSAGQPAGDQSGAYRRRTGPGLRTRCPTLRRGPRPVVHPCHRRPCRRPDSGRARRRRALRHAPNDYEHEFIYAEANLGSRSAYLDLDRPAGRDGATTLLEDADVVVNNHRTGSLSAADSIHDSWQSGTPVSSTSGELLRPEWSVDRARRLRHERLGRVGPHDHRGGDADPTLPVTLLINDYVTGYLGAVGAAAALVKRATEGGSWHVNVSSTRTAMWCGSLGLVDPALAGSDDAHRPREPDPYDAPSPLGDVHVLAPPVSFSKTPPAWPDPLLVPRGSSPAAWRR